jgi:hypothetical protein
VWRVCAFTLLVLCATCFTRRPRDPGFRFVPNRTRKIRVFRWVTDCTPSATWVEFVRQAKTNPLSDRVSCCTRRVRGVTVLPAAGLGVKFVQPARTNPLFDRVWNLTRRVRGVTGLPSAALVCGLRLGSKRHHRFLRVVTTTPLVLGCVSTAPLSSAGCSFNTKRNPFHDWVQDFTRFAL